MNIGTETRLAAACALAVGIGLSAYAQGGSQPSSTQPQSQRPSGQTPSGQSPSGQTMTGETVSVTGCVVRDSATNASQGQTQGMFKLTNVQMSGASPSSSSANAGRTNNSGASNNSGEGSSNSSASSSAAAGRNAMSQPAEYHLVAGSGVDLSQHVNHRVQISGTQTNGRGGRAGASTMGNSTGSANAPGPGASNSGGSTNAPGGGASNSGGSTNAPGGSASNSGGSANAPGAGASSNSGSGTTRTGDAQDAARRGGQAGVAAVPTLTVTNVTMIASTCQ